MNFNELQSRKSQFKKPFKNNRGQGLMEYLILVALIAVVSIGAVKVVGKNIFTQYEKINRALGSKTHGPLQIESAQGINSQKDLSNFLDHARTN